MEEFGHFSHHKAYLIEDHIVDQTRSFCGAGGDKAEHHIESHHQDFNWGSRLQKIFLKNLTKHTQLRNVKMCQHASIICAQQNVTNASKQKRSYHKVKDFEMRKEQKIIIKKKNETNMLKCSNIVVILTILFF